MNPQGMTVNSITERDPSKTDANKAGKGVVSGGKAPSKSWIIKLNPLEIYKKYNLFNLKNQEQRHYPSTRSFSRTISIHYLECDDYVNYGQRKPEEISPSPFSLHSANSSSVHSTLIENTTNTTEETNQQLEENQSFFDEKLGEAENQHQKEEISDHNSMIEEDNQSETHLNKSHSFPSSAPPVHFGSFLNKDQESMNSQGDNGRARNHFKTLKSRIKDVLGENQKQKERISWDSILHKVPYGSKASQKIRLEKPFSFEATKANRRTRSLPESLEQYAQLLESNNKREPRIKDFEKLRLVDGGGNLQGKKPPKIIKRISSFPEIKLAFFREDDRINLLHSRSMSLDQILAISTIDTNAASNVGHSVKDSINDEPLGKSVIVSLNELRDQNTYPKSGSAPEFYSSSVNHSHRSEFSSTPGKFEKATFNGNDENAVSVVTETDSTSDDRKNKGAQFKIDAIRDQLCTKHEREFLLLVDVLKSYLSSSVDLTELNSFFGPPHDLDFESKSSTSIPDEDLLNDMTHETLLETLENTQRLFPKEPMIHVVFRVLRQAWARISWHLEFEGKSGNAVEYLIDRDFRRNDGWMELSEEVHDAVIDMEKLLLDDLMEEAVMGHLA